MPYNGIKAERDRKRLAEAILAAKGKPFEADMPVQGSARVSSPFGMREHPILHERKMHTGADLAVPMGTPVYATADGYISQAQHKSAGDPRGNNVSVTHPGGQETRYAHLDRFSPEALRGGQVKRGTLLGYSGTTGRSTGPHLHYGQYDKKSGRPVDPMEAVVPWARYAGVS